MQYRKEKREGKKEIKGEREKEKEKEIERFNLLIQYQIITKFRAMPV